MDSKLPNWEISSSLDSEFLENSIGVSQGSNLGSLLFLIFFNDLPTVIKSDIECYADDSTISATGEPMQEIKNILTWDCKSFSNWMGQNKSKLNVENTNLLVVGTAAKQNTLSWNSNG